MNIELGNTPYFVLMNGKQRLGPVLLPTDLTSTSAAIYGFSDKPPYDLFLANCELALTPYPLVKGYLKNQIADARDGIQLVVVDAAGPNETQVNAATMSSVLEAQEKKSERVTISFHLMLDRDSQAYRVEKFLDKLELASSLAKTP